MKGLQIVWQSMMRCFRWRVLFPPFDRRWKCHRDFLLQGYGIRRVFCFMWSRSFGEWLWLLYLWIESDWQVKSVLGTRLLTISSLAKTADAKYWCISEMPEKWQRFASYNLLECPWPHDVVFVTIQTLGSGLADSSNYLSTAAVFS